MQEFAAGSHVGSLVQVTCREDRDKIRGELEGLWKGMRVCEGWQGHRGLMAPWRGA